MTNLTNIKAVKLSNRRIELSVNAQGKPVARHYRTLTAGRNKGQLKLVEAYYFLNDNKRAEWVEKLVNAIVKAENEKKAMIARKKEVMANMNHGITVGTIFYDSWGYEQTNVDFYQVVEVKEKTVKIRPINGFIVEYTGHDSGRKAPRKDDFEGEEILTKKIGFTINNAGEASFHINSKFGWCSVYDQGAHGVYCSWGY